MTTLTILAGSFCALAIILHCTSIIIVIARHRKPDADVGSLEQAEGDQREAPCRAAHGARTRRQLPRPLASRLTIPQPHDDREADDRHRNAEQGDVDDQRRGAAGRPLPVGHPVNARKITAQRPCGDEQQRDPRDRARCRLVDTGHRHTNRLVALTAAVAGLSLSWHARGSARRRFWGRSCGDTNATRRCIAIRCDISVRRLSLAQ